MSHAPRHWIAGVVVIVVLIGGVSAWTMVRSFAPAASSGIAINPPWPAPTPHNGQPPASTLPPSATTSPALNPSTSLPVGGNATPENTSSPTSDVLPHEPTTTALSAASTDIVVHVAGAVKHPGVYHLPAAARGDDALKAAGGAAKNANTDAINLAARLEDGSQLFFPTRQQQPDGGAADNPTGPQPAGSKATGTAAKATTKAAGSKAKAKSKARGGKSDKLTTPGQGSVNINRASEEELQKLPGVGPAMAARIVEFRRENKAFQTPEDLLNVSGIGEKKFAKMQPFVRVK